MYFFKINQQNIDQTHVIFVDISLYIDHIREKDINKKQNSQTIKNVHLTMKQKKNKRRSRFLNLTLYLSCNKTLTILFLSCQLNTNVLFSGQDNKYITIVVKYAVRRLFKYRLFRCFYQLEFQYDNAFYYSFFFLELAK